MHPRKDAEAQRMNSFATLLERSGREIKRSRKQRNLQIVMQRTQKCAAGAVVLSKIIECKMEGEAPAEP